MSGFSAEWLSLRESADHRARDAALRACVASHFAGRDRMTIVDLGCGAGSNLRALAPHLPARQTWRLIDHDPLLLTEARVTLTQWADRVETDDPLILAKNDRRVTVIPAATDLSRFDKDALDDSADLVTAAAFFDLVSPEWIESFVAALARRRLPLYAVLTYDGQESWSPPHMADAPMLAAFHSHQARDKGFGAAAGPKAAPILRRELELRGYAVDVAPSPWRLGVSDAALIEALADGAASAIVETGLVAPDRVEDCRNTRRIAKACEIGHVDLFAIPLSVAD